MPSAPIHTWSVTNCRPAALASKRAMNEIAIPSAASEPRTARRPASARGTNAPSTPTNSGSQMRIESVMRSARGASRGLHEEVEGHGADPDHHQRDVVAQEAGLAATHDRRERARGAGRTAGDAAVDDVALDRRADEAAGELGGTYDQQVDQLVEVPLVVEERVQRGEAGLKPRR